VAAGETEPTSWLPRVSIEQGEAVYVVASKSAVTDALRQLREDMQRAERMAGRGGDNPAERLADNSLAESLAET